MKDNIQVSISCITYNQKDYIRQAVDGFLMQKTNFDYEIIIHDDASTDGTADILKEYQSRYPDKIRLILQDENQLSKGVGPTTNFILPQVRGKYIACCDGDDFWIYDGKLQEQYDLMESHDEISACYHNAIIWAQKDDIYDINVKNHPTGYISDEDVICTTKGWYPTASIFMRTEYIKEQPEFSVSTGDEVWRNYLACRGKLYFINGVWSVYRFLSKGGWNTKYWSDKEFSKKYVKKVISYLREFNQYSQGRFEKYLKNRLFKVISNCSLLYETKHSIKELRICIAELKNATEHEIDFVLDEYYSLNAIMCRDYYRATIEEQIKKSDELYIYGAGREAVTALIELDKNNISPKGFIISDNRNFPSKLLGIPVYGVEEFVFNENKRIWPCLVFGRKEVLEILKNKGCQQIVI